MMIGLTLTAGAGAASAGSARATESDSSGPSAATHPGALAGEGVGLRRGKTEAGRGLG
jgi:hypothetical protein